MRKFLWVMAVGTLVLALAAPAMALNFKFGGEYRVRFYTGVGVGFTDLAGSNPRGAQIRIRPLFDVTDDNGNIQGLLRLEIGDIEFGNGGGAVGVTNGVNPTPGSARVGNGSGGSAGNDGVNVETKWAWIDAQVPFGIPLRVRAGLQPWFLPKGLIVDDDTAGVRAYGEVKPVSYDVAWYRVSGGLATNATTSQTVCVNSTTGAITVPISPATTCPSGTTTASAQISPTQLNASTSNTIDNNYDFYQFKVDVAIAPFINPGLYYIYGRNAATALTDGSLDTHYIGFTATGKAGIVSYDFDFVYGVAEGGPAGTFCTSATGASATCGTTGAQVADTKGWAIDASVHIPVGPVTINVAGSIASGDERDGGDSEAFPYIAPSWNGPGGLFHIIGSGGPFDAVEWTQDAPTNLWTIGVTADYRPVKQLLTTVGVAYAGFYDKDGNCGAVVPSPTAANTACFGPSYPVLAGESGLGVEAFLRADWTVWTGFRVQGMAGWLFTERGEDAQEYILQLLYSF